MESPRSPTPPLPSRHSYRRLRPPRQDTLYDLIPPPLSISKRGRTYSPSNIVYVSVLEIPQLTPSRPSTASSNHSATWSRSSSSHASTPASSAPSSPTPRPRALAYVPTSSLPAPSPTPSIWSTSWEPPTRPSLRRKKSPKRETLRTLRIKDSEACLQDIYDEQTSEYLCGSIFSALGVVDEDE
jgi:hypothetical protein